MPRDWLFLGCRHGQHDWHHVGGCNAGCHADCICSVPVHKCIVCGEYDYGKNEEAVEVRRECAEMYGDPAYRFAPLVHEAGDKRLADHDLAYTNPRAYNQFI